MLRRQTLTEALVNMDLLGNDDQPSSPASSKISVDAASPRSSSSNESPLSKITLTESSSMAHILKIFPQSPVASPSGSPAAASIGFSLSPITPGTSKTDRSLYSITPSSTVSSSSPLSLTAVVSNVLAKDEMAPAAPASFFAYR